MSSMPTIIVTPSRRPSEVISYDGETFTTVTLAPSRESTGTKSHDGKPCTITTTSRVDREDTKKRQQSWSSWLTTKCTTDPHQGWKPLSMTTPILASLTLLTLLIAASIELLAQQSRLKGGLALSPSLGSMPNHAKWAYLYGPNVVAVLYSLIWSWVDLDVKRMQPWLELSKPEGARAEDSLFLDYPFDFVAMAPWRAGRKGHWMVVLGGTAMVLVFWAITPLQSAVLGTGVVITNYTVPVVSRSALIPMEEQAGTLRGQVSNQAYAIGWLNQSMPEFQTMKYAYAPFKPLDTDSILPGTNWTAETTRYWTELTCWPAIEKPNPSTAVDRPTHPMFNNGGNCTYAGRIGSGDYPDAYTLGYLGFYTTEYAPLRLQSELCPEDPDSAHQFFAGWKYPSQSPVAPKGKNWTAIFCQPEYYKQQVSLTVDASTRRPIEHLVEERSEKDILSETEFNRTAFEFFLSNGNTGLDTYMDRAVDEPYKSSSIDQRNRIALNFNVSRYTKDNMIGYALALENRPVQELGHPEALHALYSRAHKFMFSLTISNLSNYSSSRTQLNDTITVSISRTGIVVSRAFAYATEAVLILVAIMTAMLTWINRGATSKLQCNPSSIERLSDLLRGEPSLVKLLRKVDNRDDESLAEKLQSVHLILESKEESHDGEAHLVIVSGGEDQVSGVDSRDKTQDHYYKPIRPLPLSKWSGIAFVICLMAACATLIYFKILEYQNNGIQRPQASFETLQFLENVVPTMFATLTEPFWVLLTRNLCMLQPFHDLCRGKARAKTTIETTYLSVPPQIVMFRAFKSRHFLLLSTCMMAFLGNFLAVGLGALFNERSLDVSDEIVLRPKVGAKFDRLGILDLHPAYTTLTGQFWEGEQITLANLSSGTALPSWTTADYFFQPFELPNLGKDQDPSTLYTLQARGFGSNGNCTAAGERQFSTNFSEPVEPEKKDQNEWLACPNLIDAFVAGLQDSYNMTLRMNQRPMPAGRSAWENSYMWDFNSNQEVCNNTYLASFARTEQANATDTTFNASFAICRPFFQTRLFNLTVDYKGLIHRAVPVSEIERTLGYRDAADHEKLMIDIAAAHFGINGDVHNDTLTYGWTTHLMSLVLDSRAFIDPLEPVPDVTKLTPVMNEIYQRKFAALYSQYTRVFQQDTENATVVGEVIGQETRIFMDTPALIISLVVLGLNLIVAVFVYAQMSSPILPRMPSSIGSLLAYVAPGSLTTAGRHWEKDRVGRENSCTYAFGRFVGEDGRAHVGIERDPYVVPIDIKSFKGKRSPWTSLLRRRKGGVEHNGPWL